MLFCYTCADVIMFMYVYNSIVAAWIYTHKHVAWLPVVDLSALVQCSLFLPGSESSGIILAFTFFHSQPYLPVMIQFPKRTSCLVGEAQSIVVLLHDGKIHSSEGKYNYTFCRETEEEIKSCHLRTHY